MGTTMKLTRLIEEGKEHQLEDEEYVALAQGNELQKVLDSTSQQVMVHPNQLDYCSPLEDCYIVP